jgi:hypothetical protein
MSIEVPSVALGSAPRVVGPDYRTAPEWPKAGLAMAGPTAWALTGRATPQRRPSALSRRSAAAAGIISDTSPPNEAISLTSEEDT